MKLRQEQGQTIIIIAVSIFLLLIMAALIIDGGNAYLNRRNAQTAADAAALAGAHEYCVNKGTMGEGGSIDLVVKQYALAENKATEVEWVFDDGEIQVTTTLDDETFFARVFGQDTATVRAYASAGCFLPGAAKNLLPIAWTCRQPVGGSSDTCILHMIPHPTFDDIVATNGEVFFETYLLDEPLVNENDPNDYQTDLTGTLGEGKMVYMVMDDDKFDPSVDCVELNPAGMINCDFNDDGIFDVEGGANRGWLLLDGTGASDLSALMLDGYPGVLELPQWFPGKSGVSNSVFINAHAIKFRVSLLPVFNAVCEDTTKDDLTTDCPPPEYVAGDLISPITGGYTFYRVPAVAAFVVTCVSKGNAEICPGKDLSGVDHNTSTIEGYFVSGFTGGTEIATSGFDLGVYILSLTE